MIGRRQKHLTELQDRHDGRRKERPAPLCTLAEAISSLAGHLDLEVVAEGIETKAQCELLTSLGCTTGQSCSFARPLSATEAQTYLRRPPTTEPSHPATSLTN